MNEKPRKPEKTAVKARREDRLGEQLRANLQKRKAQTRARRTGDADGRSEGIDAVKPIPDR